MFHLHGGVLVGTSRHDAMSSLVSPVLSRKLDTYAWSHATKVSPVSSRYVATKLEVNFCQNEMKANDFIVHHTIAEAKSKSRAKSYHMH